MTSPTISVVMPVFNRERFVEQAVSSILDQTFRDFELIVVDDGSDDGSLAVVERLAKLDSRIVVIRQPNQGVVLSRNRAIAAARGEYIALMDSDDISRPRRLELQNAFLDSHRNVAAVGGAVRVIDEAERELSLQRYPLEPDDVKRVLENGDSAFANPTLMFRASALRDVGGYRRAFVKGAEDIDLMLRIAERNRIGNLADILVDYRFHRNQMSLGLAKDAALASLVAHRCAELRREKKADPVDGAESITDETLRQIGSTAMEKENAVLRGLLNGAHNALNWGLPDMAERFNAEARRNLNSKELLSNWGFYILWTEGKIRLKTRRSVSGIWHLMHAAVRNPRLAGKILWTQRRHLKFRQA